MKRVASALLFVAFMGVLCPLEIHMAKASSTIYIRVDGSIDPPTAPIDRVGYVYTLVGNVSDGIVIEGNGIVFNGNHKAVQGDGAGIGLCILGQNVVLKDASVENFSIGVCVNSSTSSVVFGNSVSKCGDWGIFVEGSSNTTILENSMANDFRGIELVDSANCTASGNSVIAEAIYNDYGIRLTRCLDTTISWNTVLSNDEGIWLQNSSDNTVSSNNVNENFYGIVVANSSRNLIFENNVCQNDQGMELRFSLDNMISENLFNQSTNHGIWLYLFSTNNSLVDNRIVENGLRGIYLSSPENKILGNYIAFNEETGIFVGSSNNTIINNIIECNEYGVWVGNYHDNLFTHNNFIDNTWQAYVPAPTPSNSWDSSYPSGGNYWSDYSGIDLYSGVYQNQTGSDWIGDSPYTINDENEDNYPLMYPYVSETEELATMFRELLDICNEMLSDMQLLNSSIQESIVNVTTLQGEYASLQLACDSLQLAYENVQQTVESLIGSCSELQEQINTLNQTLQTRVEAIQNGYNLLNATLTSRMEAVESELAVIRTLTILFAATAMLLALIVVTLKLKRHKKSEKT